MGDILVDLVEWIQQLPTIAIYLTILGIAYVENVLPPVPGDLIVVFGGYLAGSGQLNLAGVIILASIGGVAGFMSMYVIGWRVGDAILKENRMRWIPRRRIHRATEWFSKFGYGLIAANRFLSGLRSVISLTVGMAKVDPLRTLFYSSLSTIIWVVLISVLGFELGENWEAVNDYLSRYSLIVTILIIIFIGLQITRYWLNIRKTAEGNS